MLEIPWYKFIMVLWGPLGILGCNVYLIFKFTGKGIEHPNWYEFP